jgi:hypothetical protein
MVSRASAVSCHPLQEVPSLRRRRSISLKRQVLRTRGPTGLDQATLTRAGTAVKRCLAERHEAGAYVRFYAYGERSAATMVMSDPGLRPPQLLAAGKGSVLGSEL